MTYIVIIYPYMTLSRAFFDRQMDLCYYPCPMETEYLTKKELMAYIKVSRTIVDKLVRQGLPHIKLDRRVLFRRGDVDKWLESKIVKK